MRAIFLVFSRGCGMRNRVAAKSPPVCKPTARPKSATRTRIANGSSILPREVDGRTLWAKRLREIVEAHTADMGGSEACSVAERSLIRRAAALEVELERLETKFALAGEAEDSSLDLYGRTAGNLRRLLEATGLKRRPRDVTPSLKEYLNARHGIIDAEACE